MELYLKIRATRWCSSLRYCDKRRKVAGSIPDCVIDIILWGRAIDLGSTQPVNRNEYQKYFLWEGRGVRRWPVCRADNVTTFKCRLS